MSAWTGDELARIGAPLEENLGAVAVELTPVDLQQIANAVTQISVQGARYSEGSQRIIDR